MDDFYSVMHDVMSYSFDTIEFDGEMEDDDEEEDDDDW